MDDPAPHQLTLHYAPDEMSGNSAIQAGSWPEWVSAIFTSFAFVVAAFAYRRDVQVRKQAQARLVYAEITHVRDFGPGDTLELLPNGATLGVGDGYHLVRPPAPSESATMLAVVGVVQATVVIHNESDELIGPARLQMVNVGRRSVYDTFSAPIGMVKPHDQIVVDVVVPNADHPDQPSLGTTLRFRDASGRWWRRHLTDPIESIHRDPDNAGPTAHERAQYAANARAFGLEPSPDPHVTWMVKWRRWKRSQKDMRRSR